MKNGKRVREVAKYDLIPGKPGSWFDFVSGFLGLVFLLIEMCISLIFFL